MKGKGSTYSGKVSMSFSYKESPGGLKGSYSGKIDIKYPSGSKGQYGPTGGSMLGYQPKILESLSNLGKLYTDPNQFNYFENSKMGGSGSGGLEGLSSDLHSSLNSKGQDMGFCELCGSPVRKPMNVCPRCFSDSFNRKVY